MNKRLKQRILNKYQEIISQYYPSVTLYEWLDNDTEGVVFEAAGLLQNEYRDFIRFQGSTGLIRKIADEEELPYVILHARKSPLI